MRLEQSELGVQKGRELAGALKEGKFPKNHISNHKEDFTRGNEELCRYRFNTYIGSCGYFLMENRLRQNRSEYCG